MAELPTDEGCAKIIQLRELRRKLDEKMRDKVNAVKSFMSEKNMRRFETEKYVISIEKQANLRVDFTKLKQMLSPEQYKEVTYASAVDYCYINPRPKLVLKDGKFVDENDENATI